MSEELFFYVTPDGELSEWLIKDGITFPEEGFQIPQEKYDRLLIEAKKSHPTYTPERQRAWALYQIVAQNRVSGTSVQALGSAATQDIAQWVRMSETQARGFLALKTRVESLADKIQGYCERQDAGVKEIVASIESAREQELQLWTANREDREAAAIVAERRQALEAAERGIITAKQAKVEFRYLIAVWVWRIGVLGLLAWKL